jgi:hypothetical protein
MAGMVADDDREPGMITEDALREVSLLLSASTVILLISFITSLKGGHLEAYLILSG